MAERGMAELRVPGLGAALAAISAESRAALAGRHRTRQVPKSLVFPSQGREGERLLTGTALSGATPHSMAPQAVRLLWMAGFSSSDPSQVGSLT
jgi:hypothetical protein